MSVVSFSELRTAAYCPRQCYYDRKNGGPTIPSHVEPIRALAFRYPSLLAADRATLSTAPIVVDPERFRAQLAETRERIDRWEALCEPPRRMALVEGRDCRGIVHKGLTDPLEPVIVSVGEPPERGVWEPQTVHAVAAAKALAWEYRRQVESAVVEYPAYGVIRRFPISTRRKATYRRTLRTVREIDGPPPRVDDRSKCDTCEYVEQCGVRTRTLRSMLGFG